MSKYVNNEYVEARTEAPVYCNQTSTDGKSYEYILTE